eukprot:jgi/Botrbrau1/224/Bobra.0022s0203.1
MGCLSAPPIEIGARRDYVSPTADKVLVEADAEVVTTPKGPPDSDWQEAIAQHLSIMDLARHARISRHWRGFLTRRLEAEKKRLKNLVLQGTPHMSPPQVSHIVRAAKLFCSGSGLLSTRHLFGAADPSMYGTGEVGLLVPLEYPGLKGDGGIKLDAYYVVGEVGCFTVLHGGEPWVGLFQICIIPPEVNGWLPWVSFYARDVHTAPGFADEFIQGLYLLLTSEDDPSWPEAEGGSIPPVPADAFFVDFVPSDLGTTPESWSLALAAGARICVSPWHANTGKFPQSFRDSHWKPLWFSPPPTRPAQAPRKESPLAEFCLPLLVAAFGPPLLKKIPSLLKRSSLLLKGIPCLLMRIPSLLIRKS